jgi:hypothetical protein
MGLQAKACMQGFLIYFFFLRSEQHVIYPIFLKKIGK